MTQLFASSGSGSICPCKSARVPEWAQPDRFSMTRDRRHNWIAVASSLGWVNLESVPPRSGLQNWTWPRIWSNCASKGLRIFSVVFSMSLKVDVLQSLAFGFQTVVYISLCTAPNLNSRRCGFLTIRNWRCRKCHVVLSFLAR